MPNPVVRRFGNGSTGSASTPPSYPPPQQLQQMYNQPSYTGPTYPPAPTRYMTLDDVVVRTGAMLGVLLLTGAVSWALASTSVAVPVLIVGALGGLGLGLYMSFSGRANAVTALAYSGFEGLFLGGISRVFEQWKSGIVIQAVTGTVVVAVGMLFVYRIGAIRVTPRFTRVVVGATIGILGLMIVNLVASLFTGGGLGLRDGGGLAIAFSVLCIVVASLNLVLDFDMIEQGIRRGADEKFAWYAAFGLMLTLVWLYLEILRLLGYLRNN